MAGVTSVKALKNKSKTKLVAEMRDGTKDFGKGDTKVHALRGIDLAIEDGKFIAIMGPSGSGKSTLLHCLAGLDKLTSGDVEIANKNVGKISDKNLTLLRRKNVGFIFQSFNLVPTLSALDNILLPLTIAKKKPDKKWFDRVVDMLGLKDRLSHVPSELSGGQQQRVAAARALVSRPAIIFADEPSGNLDSKAGNELLKFMRKAVDELGQSIIMVTHDPNAAAYADQVVFLDDGRIVDSMNSPTSNKILDRLKKLGV